MGHSTAGGALRATERQRAQPHGQTQHAHRYPSGGTVLKGALVLGGIGAGLALRRSLWPAETKSTHGAPGVGNTTQQQPQGAPDFVPLALSPVPVEYRAIVASNDEAVELTNAQRELLLKLEAEPNGENALKSVSNEYATLSRDPSGPNVFRWRHLAPEATLRRPMPGRVIICLGGQCVVVSSQRATSIITEAFPLYKGDVRVGDKVLSAECAAMALALYEHDVGRAEAISDSNGGWLGTPATCSVSRGNLTMHCHYKLQDGTEQRQEIRVANLERLLRTLPTAAIDEGLVSQVVDSKTATVRALDLSGQCADEAQNYRAIVASKRTESTATALTDLQKRFLCELRANADEERFIGDHASMYRLEEPGDRDSFLWRPIGHEATLCKPTTGHIIVCLDGEFTVMNSQEALKCIKDAGNIRPVCAAIAVALFTKRAGSNGTEGDQATAFSDHSGSWLKSPATGTWKRHTGIQCTCFLTDGATEVTEILWQHLSPYKPPVSDATEGGASHADTGYRGQQMSADTGWFKDLFGFLDTNESRNDAKFARDKENFTYDAGTGVLSMVGDPGATWRAGTFTTPEPPGATRWSDGTDAECGFDGDVCYGRHRHPSRRPRVRRGRFSGRIAI